MAAIAHRSSAFTGVSVSRRAQVTRAATRSARPVAVRAMLHDYQDPDFIQETLAAFPDAGVATPHEARQVSIELRATHPTLHDNAALPGAIRCSICIYVVNANL